MGNRFFYLETKKKFVSDIKRHLNDYVAEMSRKAALYGVRNDREMVSWQNNANELSSLLQSSNIPDDVMVGFEYLVPVAGRIDCVLMGHGTDGKKNMIHIELKQWSNDNVSHYYDGYCVNVAGFRSGNKVCSHPSAQAAEYQTHLENYLVALEECDINLKGFAYCYNYEAKNENSVLTSNAFEVVLGMYPLYCKDTKEEFAQELTKLLGGGKGEEIAKAVSESEIRPTKRLQDAAKNMFDGAKDSPEFSLLGEQLDAYNAILGAIQNTDKENEKTVVIVKGGPGTGKSVIAMRLVSGLAKLGKYPNVYYSTRSKSLRKGFQEILKNISYKKGETANCTDLIKNNLDFRPGKFDGKENAVNALIVDEAHRISRSANHFTDRKKGQETHLTQIMAMLYTARVSVFFIDDNQGIESKEIGTAEGIKTAANSYYKRILAENENQKKEYAKIEDKIDKKKQEIAELVQSGADDKIINKEKEKLNSLLTENEYNLKWLEDVKPTNLKVHVLEFKLTDQFRCNGSDNYLDWIDSVFCSGENATAIKLDHNLYDFNVFDTPQALYQKIRELDDYAVWADKCKEEMCNDFSYKALKERKKKEKITFKQRARLVAGYHWPWSDKEKQENGDLLYEVKIPEHKFEMPWETKARPKGDFAYKYAKNEDSWIRHDEGVNQIGCVYSSQGWEVDYVGVIIGPELKYDKEKDCLQSDPTEEIHPNKNIPREKTAHDKLIKDIYRVLMTRGMKGCYVFACDPGVRDYLRRKMNQ